MRLSFLCRSTDQMTFRPMIGMGQATRGEKKKKNRETKNRNLVSNLQRQHRPRSRAGPASACCRRPGLGSSLPPWPLIEMRQRPSEALRASASRRWTRAAMPYCGVVSRGWKLSGAGLSQARWMECGLSECNVRDARHSDTAESRRMQWGWDERRKKRSDDEEWTRGLKKSFPPSWDGQGGCSRLLKGWNRQVTPLLRLRLFFSQVKNTGNKYQEKLPLLVSLHGVAPPDWG